MAQDRREAANQSPAARMLGQIEYCLQQKCVICIEHAPYMTPRWSAWTTWGKPGYFNGNAHQIYDQIDRCRVTHADHYIRLNIENHSCSSRFCFVVHSPNQSPGRD